ncbi:recombinase family protein [Bradyrhizobium jicamae]|uniref:recombinase family protein n=1 Tax=Bradyrhizobium jicamae TaxID=280332 RepID=UPI001BA96690|nr:recombinase family protein [Bradyrhizobium jicamae]MBR0937296.1 recombinase family protein [Bradyrhizobium jicamae]
MTNTGKFVCYYRVSTVRQGKSGLGLEAQKHAVTEFLNGGDWSIVGEFTEIESGKRSDRTALGKALAMCRLHGAKLVIAKLDRLSRNAAFLLNLRDSGVDFVCADMPNANKLTVGIMAMVAEDEAERISDRTRKALAAAKRRGVTLGGFRGKVPTAKHRALSAEARQRAASNRASDIGPVIAELQAAGKTSLRDIAAGLNAQGIPTSRGNGAWTAVQVARVLARLSWE